MTVAHIWKRTRHVCDICGKKLEYAGCGLRFSDNWGTVRTVDNQHAKSGDVCGECLDGAGTLTRLLETDRAGMVEFPQGES